MAPHSNTLAWKIPWTEEPGRLQSMGSWRVGYDWVTSLSCIGEGNGNLLQCSCLENPRDGGDWWAAVFGVTQSQTRLKQVSSSSSSLYLERQRPGLRDYEHSGRLEYNSAWTAHSGTQEETDHRTGWATDPWMPTATPVPPSGKDCAAEVGPGGVTGCRGGEDTAKLLRGQAVTAFPTSVVFRLQPGLAGLSWQLACLHCWAETGFS